MQYSLLSRFSGTLTGTAVGQVIGKSGYEWELLLVLGMQSLVRLGRFEADDWRCTFKNKANSFTRAIVTTLPIALFYHENKIKLQQNLELALMAAWQNEPSSRDSALAIGYAIAQALTEKLNPKELIPQTVAFLGQPQTQLAQQLLRVQTLLEEQAGLERVQTAIGRQIAQPTASIAMAFYCFLSTYEDFRLSVMRAAQNSYQPEFTTALVGALSGAYNSASGIPASLQLMLFGCQPKLVTEMLELSDSLVAVWSGVYDQPTRSTEMTKVAAIAAPRVIRPR